MFLDRQILHPCLEELIDKEKLVSLQYIYFQIYISSVLASSILIIESDHRHICDQVLHTKFSFSELFNNFKFCFFPINFTFFKAIIFCINSLY